ncbi:MAG TPA: imelysin family protein [Polyangiaceae bacterium]|nr:imelysin family protein [Polyangiaceae bacterium]
MRNPLLRLTARAPRAFAALLAPLLVLSGCRKPAPEEHVYTGAAPPSSPGTGAGGSGAVPGAGGTPSAGAGSVPEGGTGATSGGQGGAPATMQFTKGALLEAAVDCAMERYSKFEERAVTLRDDLAALDESPTDAALDRARRSFVSAMESWQEAELFRFGPAARSAEPGGQNLRDEIYGWPLVSTCRVDEQIVNEAYAATDFATASFVNGRTLSALDYLLFYEGRESTCTALSPIVQSGAFAALSEDELRKRRAAYALRVAEGVLARVRELSRAWDPKGGNFRGEMLAAGSGSGTFASEHVALNAVSNALFYLDKEVKDWKLARPAGLGECFSGNCAELVEARYARTSVTYIVRNLAGFRRLFQGCGSGGQGVGFDDWLAAVGAEELRDAMLEALDEAEASIAEIASLEAALASEPDRVAAAHAKVKAITDLLKADFITMLDLELPIATASDND